MPALNPVMTSEQLDTYNRLRREHLNEHAYAHGWTDMDLIGATLFVYLRATGISETIKVNPDGSIQ